MKIEASKTNKKILEYNKIPYSVIAEEKTYFVISKSDLEKFNECKENYLLKRRKNLW